MLLRPRKKGGGPGRKRVSGHLVKLWVGPRFHILRFGILLTAIPVKFLVVIVEVPGRWTGGGGVQPSLTLFICTVKSQGGY